MGYSIIGTPRIEPEYVEGWNLEEIIDLCIKYPDCVFRFSETDYYPEWLHSWRGAYNLPSISYSSEPVTGSELASRLSYALTISHEGWKGGTYTYNENHIPYIAQEGEASEDVIVGYELRGNEVILLTMIDEY